MKIKQGYFSVKYQKGRHFIYLPDVLPRVPPSRTRAHSCYMTIYGKVILINISHSGAALAAATVTNYIP